MKATNGVYQIKPNVEIEPFYVSCDFSTDQPITIIKHDHDGFGITSKRSKRLHESGQSDGCDEAGCFEVKISYESEIDQIKTLIDISERCEQRIINNCTGNAISNFAWWTDRNGNQLEYWDGNHPEGTQGCKCHLDGDGCNENAQGDSYFCNCDADGEFDIDDGTLTSKQQLPVLQLNYGGSGNRYSWILYQLGYLKCYGKAEGIIYPSEQNQNRIENIKNDIEDHSVEIESVKERTGRNENDIEQNTVDIASVGNDLSSLKARTTTLEETVNQVDYYFQYKAARTPMIGGNNLVFPTNISGNDYDAFDGNSGIFTSPITGRYSFGLYIRVHNGSYDYNYLIRMRRSGSTIHSIYVSGTRDPARPYDGRYFQTEVELTKGQTVDFYIDSSGLTSGLEYSSDSFLEGKLIKAD